MAANPPELAVNIIAMVLTQYATKYRCHRSLRPLAAPAKQELQQLVNRAADSIFISSSELNGISDDALC